MKTAGGLMDGIRAPEAGDKKTIITGYDDRLAFASQAPFPGRLFVCMAEKLTEVYRQLSGMADPCFLGR